MLSRKEGAGKPLNSSPRLKLNERSNYGKRYEKVRVNKSPDVAGRKKENSKGGAKCKPDGLKLYVGGGARKDKKRK